MDGNIFFGKFLQKNTIIIIFGVYEMSFDQQIFGSVRTSRNGYLSVSDFKLFSQHSPKISQVRLQQTDKP